MLKPDLLMVGGGIIGCSAAAIAAERGASVMLIEGSQLAAGASGRNSGVVQHPFDPVLAPLHQATLEAYRELSDEGDGVDFPAEPAGLLLLTDDPATAPARVAARTGAGAGGRIPGFRSLVPAGAYAGPRPVRHPSGDRLPHSSRSCHALDGRPRQVGRCAAADRPAGRRRARRSGSNPGGWDPARSGQRAGGRRPPGAPLCSIHQGHGSRFSRPMA